MTTVLNGLIGGSLAAVIAVGLTRLIAGSQSERNATVSSTGDPLQSRWWTVGLSVIYGAVAGGALLLLELHVLGVLGVPPSVLEALGTTLLWSVVLCAVWLAVRRFVSSRLKNVAVYQAVWFHFLFGVSLGLWIRFTWIT